MTPDRAVTRPSASGGSPRQGPSTGKTVRPCTWLASTQSSAVTGRVFQVAGSEIAIAESFHKGPRAANTDDPNEMHDIVADLMARANLNSDMSGEYVEGPGRPTKSIGTPSP